MSSNPHPMLAGVILLPPGEGRRYPCGPMQSVFLADGEETGARYAASIWWVDAVKPGPGAHSHEANEEGGFESHMPGIVEWYRLHAQR